MISYQQLVCGFVVDRYVWFQDIEMEGRGQKSSGSTPSLAICKQQTLSQPGVNMAVSSPKALGLGICLKIVFYYSCHTKNNMTLRKCTSEDIQLEVYWWILFSLCVILEWISEKRLNGANVLQSKNLWSILYYLLFNNKRMLSLLSQVLHSITIKIKFKLFVSVPCRQTEVN